MVQGGVIVTIEQRRDQEAVVCYDSATGTEIWANSYSADFEETMGGPGPRATPTIAGDEVYSYGAIGDLLCIDLKTGKTKWAVKTLANNDNIMWAMSGSPLVYENMVIVNPGTQKDSAKGKAVCAFNRANGELIWGSGDTRAGYSSPMLATLAGKLQVVQFDADCIAGYDLKDGTRLWKFDWPIGNGVNVAQPLVLSEDRVFISTSYDVAAGRLCLKVTFDDGKWQVKELWKNNKLRCKFTSPVFYEGFIYGLDEGILACVEASSGKPFKWRDGRYGHGQILLTGDLILILSETGKLVLVQATLLNAASRIRGASRYSRATRPGTTWPWRGHLLPPQSRGDGSAMNCRWQRRIERASVVTQNMGERRGVSPTCRLSSNASTDLAKKTRQRMRAGHVGLTPRRSPETRRGSELSSEGSCVIKRSRTTFISSRRLCRSKI